MKLGRILAVLIIVVAFSIFFGWVGFQLSEKDYTVTGLFGLGGVVLGLFFVGLVMTGPEDRPSYIHEPQKRKRV